MSSWWVDSEDAERALSEERLVVRVAELLSGAIERRGTLKKDLANALNIKPAELSQRISGRRNLTLRSLAAMAHELGCDVEVALVPKEPKASRRIIAHRTMDWPGDVRYTKTGVAVRGIAGAA